MCACLLRALGCNALWNVCCTVHDYAQSRGSEIIGTQSWAYVDFINSSNSRSSISIKLHT